MAPKKGSKGRKGKKGKKKNLTEEEKKKLAEQKALAEKEKLARRRDLTKAFLTLKKEKEYELMKVNERKILDMWRPLIRKQRISELLEDYKAMQHAFERAYDRKNNLIHDLEKQLEQNEGEYDHAVDMHMYNIDKMMEFYQKRGKEIRELFLERRTSLMDRLNDEKHRIQDHHQNSVKSILDKMAATKKHFSDIDKQSKQEMLQREEDVRSKEMQEMFLFKNIMDQRINKYWQTIQDRVLNFEQVTADKRKEYIKLLDRDAEVAALIKLQFEKHAILKSGIEKLDRRTALFQKTFAHYIQDLVDKKAECRALYNQLMTRRRLLVESSRGNIGHLAITSKDVIEKMDAMLSTRSRILMASERCRREEQLQEKVDPFLKRLNMAIFVDPEAKEDDDENPLDENYSPRGSIPNIPNPRTDFRVRSAVHSFDCECDVCSCAEVTRVGSYGGDSGSRLAASIKKLISEYSILERFWIRFNKVTMDKGALLERRDMLARENICLKEGLRNYMGGMNPLCLDPGKFAEQIMTKDQTKMGVMMRMYHAEKKRRERSRKVGGIRMF